MVLVLATLFHFMALSLLVVVSHRQHHQRPRCDSSSEHAPPQWTYRRTKTDYEAPYGPREWAEGYPDCGMHSQSPINIAADLETIVNAEDYKLVFYSNECDSDELFFQADERVWEVIFKECSDTPHIDFQDEQYNLVQIHVHSPSEHAIGGSLHSAEIHWVHVRNGTDDDLLVVGVLMDVIEYGTNVELQHLWDALDIGQNTTHEVFVTRIYDMMPSNPAFSHYNGSLTTPPCTEGVKWIVMSDTIIMGERQLEDFRTSVALYENSKVDEQGNTNRPLQPLNGREILFVTP